MANSASSSRESYSALAPSQAMNPTGGNDQNSRGTSKGKKKKNTKTNESNADQLQGSTDDANSNGRGKSQPQKQAVKGRKNQRRNRSRKQKDDLGSDNSITRNDNVTANTGEDTGNGTSPDGAKQQPKLRKGKNNRKRPKPKKKYPWRRFIPKGTVDPITLENLIALDYPPFALVADAPYEPVPIWPVPEQNDKQALGKTEDNIEELNRQRIAAQWGEKLDSTDKDKNDSAQRSTEPGKRHYNLYDGRALAYYIVSQLQFIDPLNRRDLTRDELLNLDVYLRRNGFKDLKVTDAYDAKGITISSAGAAAATAQGRADILQQMASNLLNSMFGGQSVSAPRSNHTREARQEPTLQEQYAALRQAEEREAQARERRSQLQTQLNPNARPFGEADNHSWDDGGIVIIDDDENPGMRGGNYGVGVSRSENNHSTSSSSNPFYSTSHITSRYGNGITQSSGSAAFPALPSPSPAAAASSQTKPTSTKKPGAKPSKTLARISGAVRKTDPTEKQRQWEAREAAIKRAMMANMSFGVDASLIGTIQQQQGGLLKPPPGIAGDRVEMEVSGERLERNRAFAEALGVKPATMRQPINSGWARPVETKVSLDEFGNELNSVIYPDSLVLQARDRMGLLLKIEKKWKNFLKDDKAASLPLNAMDKPSRAFVHHYSDFWNLNTESFDPEPRRYIHCTKLANTHMPYPLLSDAARAWRGPTQVTAPKTQQSAGQPSKSREIPPPPIRVPLALQPRSLPEGEQKPDNIRPESGNLQMTSDKSQMNSRLDGIIGERERPKIELAKRTVPLELPPFQPEKQWSLDEARQRRRAIDEERKRKQAELAKQKQRALEDAFASDDESDNAQSSGSEWEEAEAVYQDSDGED